MTDNARRDVLTFGCRLNAYESEQIRAALAESGEDNIVVVNTCAVTGEAVRQARQQIRRTRREHPDARIIVTGCAAQTEPETFAAMPEVDAVIGNADKAKAAAYAAVPDFGASAAEKVRVNDIMELRETAHHMIDGLKDRARAFVQVQNGCDHRCTFCIIPYGRGNSRSVPMGAVVDQVRRLVGGGINEIVLTGVDITSYGTDLPGAPRLGDLCARILKAMPELMRLRLSSLDAVEIDPALFELVTGEARLMPHLHLSLQAGDNMILKRMKRRHAREDAIRLCADLRARRTDIAFGADIIAGFPTETDEMFARSLELVDECGLSFLHVFPFSPRKGTPAARMPQLSGTVIRARAAALRDKGEDALARHLARQVGRTLSVLVEEPLRARAPDFCEVILDKPATPGAIIETSITAATRTTLQAQAASGALAA